MTVLLSTLTTAVVLVMIARKVSGASVQPLAANAATPSSSASTDLQLPSLREQAQIREEWISFRTTQILPTLMQENGIKYWVLSQREYHEDVVWRSVASPTQINARRRTVIVYALGKYIIVVRFPHIYFRPVLNDDESQAVANIPVV